MTHRIRETDKGLQLTDGQGVLTFQNNDALGMSVSLERTYTADTTDNYHFILEGRDNIRDLSEWFLNLNTTLSEETDLDSCIQSYTVNGNESVCCIAVKKIHHELPFGLQVAALGLALPLRFQEGYIPVLLANQRYNQLTLYLDRELRYLRISHRVANLFGEFLFDGLDSIRRKSVFG